MEMASAVEAAGPVPGTPSQEASGAASDEVSVCGAEVASGAGSEEASVLGTEVVSGVPWASAAVASECAMDSGTPPMEAPLDEEQMRCVLATFAAASGNLAHVVAQSLAKMRGGPLATESVAEVLVCLEPRVRALASVLGELRPQMDAWASAAPVASGLGSPSRLGPAPGWASAGRVPVTPSPPGSVAPFTPAAGATPEGTPPPSPEPDAEPVQVVPTTPLARAPRVVGAAHLVRPPPKRRCVGASFN